MEPINVENKKKGMPSRKEYPDQNTSYEWIHVEESPSSIESPREALEMPTLEDDAEEETPQLLPVGDLKVLCNKMEGARAGEGDKVAEKPEGTEKLGNYSEASAQQHAIMDELLKSLMREQESNAMELVKCKRSLMREYKSNATEIVKLKRTLKRERGNRKKFSIQIGFDESIQSDLVALLLAVVVTMLVGLLVITVRTR